ncbi:MAG: hypothetical protein ACRC11_16480 [Xenococcaceae cyanobacterium]
MKSLLLDRSSIKELLLAAVAGLAVGTGLSLVMPENEHYTNFTFEQNVSLSNNTKKQTQVQIDGREFNVYDIDDTQLVKSLAPKTNLLENIGELYARVTTKFDIEVSVPNFQLK